MPEKEATKAMQINIKSRQPTIILLSPQKTCVFEQIKKKQWMNDLMNVMLKCMLLSLGSFSSVAEVLCCLFLCHKPPII